MEMRPRYAHNCTKCRFVASIFSRHQVQDWYVCEGGDPSVIARNSDHYSDYWSMPIDMVNPNRLCVTFGAEEETPYLSEMQILASFVLSQHKKETA